MPFNMSPISVDAKNDLLVYVAHCIKLYVAHRKTLNSWIILYIVLLYVLEANLNSQSHNNARLTTRVTSKEDFFLRHPV